MRAPPVLLAALVALGAAAAAANLHAQPAVAPSAPAVAALVTPLPGGAVVDWSAGTIAAPGVAAADLRAPNIEVARVTAERVASERARAALARAIRSLPLASGGTAGAKLDDPKSAARLEAALAHARSLDVSYAADGGARVLLALPLEAIRAALAPPAPPAEEPAAPTAVVVDATKLAALRPGLAVRVSARGAAPSAAVALPTVWVGSPGAADADVRAGRSRTAAVATSAAQGVLTLDLDPAVLESAARAGALIVVVVGEGARK